MENRSDDALAAAPVTLWARLNRVAAHPAFVPTILFVLAFTLRTPLLRVPIYGDEAGMFYFSRHPLQDAENVRPGIFPTYEVAHFFWWRPLYRLAFTPAALISFDAYRIFHLLLASALPVLGTLILRARGVRAWLVVAGGLALAVYPTLVHWSEIVFPDMPMVVAFFAGLLAHARRSPLRTGILFTASLWLKETAIIGVAVVFAWSAWDGVRAKRMRLWPPRLDLMSNALVLAALLGLAPLLVYLGHGGVSPGWTPGVNPPEMLDTLLPSLWLVPLLLAGLVWTRTRLIATLPMAYFVFYSVWTWVLGEWVQDWYQVQPIALALLAFVLVLDEGLRRTFTHASIRSRTIPWAALAATASIVMVQVVVPSAWEPKSTLTMPIGAPAAKATWEHYESDHYFDARADLEAHLAPADYGTILLVDVPWFFVLYPFSERSDEVVWNWTWQPFGRDDIVRWAELVENSSDATLVHTPASTIHPMNAALRAAYSSCVAFVNVDYTLIRGAACAGRSDELWREYERRSGGAP